MKFKHWRNLVSSGAAVLRTYRTPNGSWIGWIECGGGKLLGFVDTGWKLHLVG